MYLYPLGEPNSWRAHALRDSDSCSLVTMAAQATLPPQAADALRDSLPLLADSIVEAIAREVPDYARPMEGRFGETVRFGVQVALNRFVDLLAGEARKESRVRDTYGRLGCRRVPPGPLAGRAAGRLPGGREGRVAPFRRRRHARRVPARFALRPGRGDLRLHRRDLRRVRGGLRRGAVGGRGREPAPPPGAVAAARAGSAAAGRGRPDRRAGRRLGAAAAGRRRRRRRGRPAPGARRRARRGGAGRGGRRRDRGAARAPDRAGRRRRRGRRARGRDDARPRGSRPAPRARGRARRRAGRASARP